MNTAIISQILNMVTQVATPIVQAIAQALPGIFQSIMGLVGGLVNSLGSGNGGTAAGTGLAVGLAGALAAGAAGGGGAVKQQPQLLGPAAANATQTTAQNSLQGAGPITAGLPNGTTPPPTQTATIQNGVFTSTPPATQNPQTI